MKLTLLALLVMGFVCFIEAGRSNRPYQRTAGRPPMNPPPNLPTRRGRSIDGDYQFQTEQPEHESNRFRREARGGNFGPHYPVYRPPPQPKPPKTWRI